MESLLEEILSSLYQMYSIIRGITFHIWIFDITFFDLLISLMVLEFILSVIFPHFMPDDDE